MDKGRLNQYKYKGRDDESARGKRREFAVSLRKDRRREKHDKRRELGDFEAEAEQFIDHDEVGQSITALRPIIEDDSDQARQLEALVQLRRLLAASRELPIEAAIQSGVLDKLVQLLQHPNPDVQYEVAWILTNISSGASHQTRAVVEHQACIPLGHLLSSPVAKVKDQAVWCLGNIAGDGAQLRDVLLEIDLLDVFLQMLVEEEDAELLRNVSWTISNFFRWKNPSAPEEKMHTALEVLKNALSEDPEVLSNLSWAICYIAESTESFLDLILMHFGGRFMHLLALPEHDAQLPAIRTMGSITAGSDEQTAAVIGMGILDVLRNLLQSKKVHVRKDACWTLSNICAGTYEQIDAVIEANLVLSLVLICQSNDSFKVRLDAAWSLCNIISQGNEQHAAYLIQNHGIEAILFIFQNEMGDAKAVTVFLEALERAIIVGDTMVRRHEAAENIPKQLMINTDFDVVLQAFADSPNDEVSKKAVDLLGYFDDLDEDEVLNPGVQSDGAAYSFGMQNNQPSGGFNL
eukprot:TRINITY_DN7057_c0_g1_i2.p1 TRINITY_DN7057_c0_g1~~TRINITY_DN7057_c0_g1_i2.p1  ORF type:complete len:520 (+),score=87.32 TRINITY_DN7057_c0_g1_i2:67-1626(+)